MRSSLHSVRFGQLLRCSHKLIVNIMKVYIERNNKIATLLNLETLKWEYRPTSATDMLIAVRFELPLMCAGAPDISGHFQLGFDSTLESKYRMS